MFNTQPRKEAWSCWAGNFWERLTFKKQKQQEQAGTILWQSRLPGPRRLRVLARSLSNTVSVRDSNSPAKGLPQKLLHFWIFYGGKMKIVRKFSKLLIDKAALQIDKALVCFPCEYLFNQKPESGGGVRPTFITTMSKLLVTLI